MMQQLTVIPQSTYWVNYAAIADDILRTEEFRDLVSAGAKYKELCSRADILWVEVELRTCIARATR